MPSGEPMKANSMNDKNLQPHRRNGGKSITYIGGFTTNTTANNNIYNNKVAETNLSKYDLVTLNSNFRLEKCTNTKKVFGILENDVLQYDVAKVLILGTITISNLTADKNYYNNAGAINLNPDYTVNNFLQKIGRSLSPNELFFNPETAFLIK